ncbi:hypothetical protein [Aeoliella sp. SH292]|uniref:hypothetical protein n=1 Tax=Aeoliella sp. SH292 TaxID=3454464 RepID=UPI003F94D9B6
MNSPKFMENHVPQLFFGRKVDLQAAIQEMLDYPGPYVLPIIPGGRTELGMIKQ